MGTNKAALVIGGRSMAGRAVDAISEVAESVVLIGRSETELADVRCPRIEDVPAEGRGAIRGLVTALEACERTWALVLACDLPFISSEMLELIVSRIEPAADVVLPLQPDGRYQPLCAVYRRSTCLPVAREAMAEHRWGLHALVERLKVRSIDPSEYAHFPAAEHLFTNLNSKADVAAAEQMLHVVKGLR